jgi:leucyl-tRNA synthetase
MAEDTPKHRYTAAFANEIEPRWQAAWDAAQAYRAPNPGEAGFDGSKPKFYCLDMFPYPSGAGLHVGHPEGYTATDIVCRYKRAKGYNVLHPMGYDAFGLPAEQYAIQTGVHPAITTKKSIETFRRQLKRFGFSYDWSREFATIDPEYYKWTQWVFLRLYNAWVDPVTGQARAISELEAALERGDSPVRPGFEWRGASKEQRRGFIDLQRLAYLAEATVNWCPKLGTVLANDEVIDGRSERGGHPVVRRPLRQWMFRITAMAERLLEDLAKIDWPQSTKTMQSEWIGRSEGAEFGFLVGRLSEPTSRNQSSKTGAASETTNDLVGHHPADEDRRFHCVSATFEARDPYPKGQPSPAGLVDSVRHLPHIELDGSTYFVTWSTKNGAVLSPQARNETMSALMHFDGERTEVYAACVMPDHVHWIVRPLAGHSLDSLVAGVKRFAATRINALTESGGSVWQEDRFDHIVRDTQWLGEFVRYVCRNPVEAKIGAKCGDYPWTYVSAALRSDDGRNLGLGGRWSPTDRPAEIGGGRRDVGSESRPTLETLRVFTTRPDTIFGATYMVVAPEHPLVAAALANPTARTDGAKLRAYVEATRSKSEVDRQAESKVKTGVDTGVDAVNPATGERIPVWTADYVLMGYGTGAIMAVPAHDERDFEFAVQFGLPVRDVVYPATILAMRFFAERARSMEAAAEEWVSRLADFLGLVTSTGTGPSGFDAAFARVMSNPRGGDEPSALSRAGLDQTADVLPGAVGQRRGAVKASWLEVVEDLDLAEPGDLRRRFENGTFYATHGAAYGGSGFVVNSGEFDGLPTDEAKSKMTAWLASRGIGARRVNFRLRDWAFSRQRYWGEPFPIVYDAAGNHYPVSPASLPVVLPDLEDYSPAESDEPQPLLAKAGSWVNTTAGAAGVDPAVLPAETPVRRETNTMPGSAGSSWYFLRYCDAGNSARFVGREAERYWMVSKKADGEPHAGGIDLYMGGSEHAVGHLLYARFWHKVLFDLGEVSTPEPFGRLFHQGMITSFAYQRADKTLVPNDMVDEVSEGKFVERATGAAVSQIVAKMSKSLKNVINPDDVIAEYGADTFRLYEMYMGPLEASKPWNPRDIVGMFRFLQKLWRVAVDEDSGAVRAAADGSADPALEKQLHRVVAKVGSTIEVLSFNTGIAAMIEFVNVCQPGVLTRGQLCRLAVVLSPFAPHMAEELWSRAGSGGGAGLVCNQAWPEVDPKMLVDDEVEMPVQVNGKLRGRVVVPAKADAKAVEAIALADAKVVAAIEGKAIKKVIVVPGKMVNFIV